MAVTNRQILRKCLGTLNVGRVDSLVRVDIVCTSIAGASAMECCASGRVECAEGFHDVVFDKRVSRPSVYLFGVLITAQMIAGEVTHTQITVPVRLPGATVCDCPSLYEVKMLSA